METETSSEPTVTPQETPPAAPATPSPWEGFQWDGKVESLPDPVADAIRAARKDAGAARTNAKAQAAQEARQELAKQVAEALGITSEEPPDPAKLTEHLERSRSETASAQVELRLFRLASKLGADADALLDSRAFCDAVDALEVDGWEDFDGKVTELIRQRQAASPAPATNSRPVEALRPGTLAGAANPSIDDQINEAQKAGNVRAVIALQNSKLANHQK